MAQVLAPPVVDWGRSCCEEGDMDFAVLDLAGLSAVITSVLSFGALVIGLFMRARSESRVE